MLSLNYEYKLVPAPRRAAKSKDLGSSDLRFASALAQAMNDMGREGWEYVRTDTLPMDERAGLTGGTKTTYLNMLVFRRVLVRESQIFDTENDDFETPPMLFDLGGKPAAITEARGDDPASPRMATE